MGITGKTTGCMFAPVPVEIAGYDPEIVGCKFLVFLIETLAFLLSLLFVVNACQKTKTTVKRQATIASDLTQIVEASQQMENMLDTILAYVEDVIAGKSPADNTFGRSLLDMIHSVPKMSVEEFEEMLNSNRKVISDHILSTNYSINILCFYFLMFYTGSSDGPLPFTAYQNTVVFK